MFSSPLKTSCLADGGKMGLSNFAILPENRSKSGWTDLRFTSSWSAFPSKNTLCKYLLPRTNPYIITLHHTWSLNCRSNAFDVGLYIMCHASCIWKKTWVGGHTNVKNCCRKIEKMNDPLPMHIVKSGMWIICGQDFPLEIAILTLQEEWWTYVTTSWKS